MTSVDETRDELTRLLGRAEQWFDGLGALGEHAPDDAEIAMESARLRSLRTRALATQLNVGLLGRQSAGKSFLISGLQGYLQYFRIADEDGDYSEEYRGLLPSSANPTTACPSTVVPVHGDAAVDAAGRGLLRVRFSDTGWEEIGKDLPPAVVGAYVASDGRRTDRLKDDHVNRRVEEMELLIAKYRLPVKLFDLPGAESVIEENDLIMRNAWREADCFIYVSQATAALTVNELDLIRDLYTEHLQTGKRVLWVLTGIDRATQREHGQAAWKNVLETNNEYLREHFPGSSDTFVGEGFLPVSAAWEAQAAPNDSGQSDDSLRRRARMETLRARLTELIESGAGRRHLVQVADEARMLIRRRQRPIADLIDAHQISGIELEKQWDAMNERLKRASEGEQSLTSQLSAALDRSIRAAEKPFGRLASELHNGLDALIDSGNLSAAHVSEINIRQVELFSQWMAAPGGPDEIWQRELVALDSTARDGLKAILGPDATNSRLVTPEPIDTASLLLADDGRRPMTAYGMVKAAAATVGVASPIVGGVAMAAAGVSLAAIAFPVSATVGAAIAALKIVDAVKQRESTMQRDRGARKALIDSQADRAKLDFGVAARERGVMLIDAAQIYLDRYRARLQATLIQIQTRIDAPDNVASRALVARLTPVDNSARDLLTELRGLHADTRD